MGIQKQLKQAKKLYIVKKSTIHKRGVFAAYDIPKDTYIIEYKGEKITKSVSHKRALDKDKKGRKYNSALVYIFELNKKYDLDGHIPNNPAKYINHSCEPNCQAVNKRGRIWILAIRDIVKGEELYFNYGYGYSSSLDHPCYCKTPSCLGYIVGDDSRAKLKKILQKKKLIS